MKALLQRLTKIDNLICHKKTGKPEALGAKVGLSERSVYEYLHLMKEMGAGIKYSRQLQSYYYTDHGQFRIGFLRNGKDAFPVSEN